MYWSDCSTLWEIESITTLPFGSTKNGAGTSFLIHGVPTYENIRVPLWLGCETGRRDLVPGGTKCFDQDRALTEAPGSDVSGEWIKGAVPDRLVSEYEYCATKKLQLTL
jgi:hypothetical protein